MIFYDSAGGTNDPLRKRRTFLKKSRSYLSTESERSTISVTSTTSAVTHSSDGATVIENIKVRMRIGGK